MQALFIAEAPSRAVGMSLTGVCRRLRAEATLEKGRRGRHDVHGDLAYTP